MGTWGSIWICNTQFVCPFTLISVIYQGLHCPFSVVFVCLFISVADPGIEKRGGRGPGAVEFCFDNPSHIPYVLVDRVVNKIHNVNIVYWLKSKYMRVIQLKFTNTNTNPNFFSKRGGARPARRSWIRLCKWLRRTYHSSKI